MLLREKSPEVTAVRANVASSYAAFDEAVKAGRIVDKLDTIRPCVMVATPQGMIRAKADDYIALSHSGALYVLSEAQVRANYERIG